MYAFIVNGVIIAWIVLRSKTEICVDFSQTFQ